MSPTVLRLRELREAKALTQLELADVVGVRQATISDLETGKAKTLRLALLDKLAKALGVSSRELLAEVPERDVRKRKGRG